MLFKKHAELPNVGQIRKVLALVVGFGSLVVSANAQDQSALGSWTDPASMPTHAIHAISLPTGKVLYFNRKGQTYLFDPSSNTSSPAALPPFDIFCTGHVSLGDGTIFFAGGHINNSYGLPCAAVYNPFTNSWRTMPKMAFARWYPTCTLMPNGKDVFVESGVITPELGNARTPEYWDSAKNLFRSLSGISMSPPLYPMQYLTRKGRIISPGPLLNTWEFDTSGAGTGKVVASRLKEVRDYGSSVQFAPGKILVGGGGTPTKTCEILDITTDTPKWSNAASMASARRQCQFTLLPNGDVLAVGGSSGPGFTNPAYPVFTPEIWSPVTGRWNSMAPSTQNGNRFCFRGYHQNAVLLSNGRIWSTAGDDSSDPSKSFPSFQLFSPPYLYAATKPTISAAPGYGLLGSFVPLGVVSNVEITGINLVRLAAVTHSNDMSQVIAPLSFRVTDSAYTAQLPSDPTHTPPGWYYLFAVDANGGVSDAKYIQIGSSVLPPTEVSVKADSAGRTISWVNPNPNSDTTLLATSVDGRVYTRAKSIVGRTSESITDLKVVYVKLQSSGPAGLSEKSVPIRITDAATTLTSKDFRGVTEGLTSMVCTLADSAGFPVPNVKVNFRLPNGVTGTAVTANDGVAEFAFEVQPNWNNSIVEAEFPGNGPFGPSRTSAKLIVSKRNTRMFVGTRTGMIGQTMNLSFSMDWIPESFLITRSGLKFRIAIDGVSIGTATTDETGFASLAYKLNPQAGTRTITATFDGDANYFKCSGSAPLVVNRASTITWSGVRDLYRGGTVNVPASLKDSVTNQFIPNASLKVYVDDVLSQTVVTDASGATTIPLFAAENAPDSSVLKVVFEGDATRAPSQISSKLKIVNPPSQVWVGNRTVKRGETATVPTTLKNSATGKFIAGATLRVQIGGLDAGTVVTDATGAASVRVSTNANSPSTIDVTLLYDGGKLIQPSKGSGTVTVQ